jgi:hypothetical protein
VAKLLTILTKKEETTMNRGFRFFAVVLAGLLTAGLAPTAAAAEPSGCVTCHLDETMLTKNLTVVKAKKSAMQSGQG